MKQSTRRLWAEQNQHEGDRWRLFQALAKTVEATTVLYPGCFVDIAPSFVFQAVTYIDIDRRTPTFFADEVGVHEIIRSHEGAPPQPQIKFIHGDYADDHGLPSQGFDLLISLYAGFISEHCTDYLQMGGTLLVNPSHGDAAMASIDPRLQLAGIINSRSGEYSVTHTDLDTYLIPKRPTKVTKDQLHALGRGIAYTKSPFAYLFTRVA